LRYREKLKEGKAETRSVVSGKIKQYPSESMACRVTTSRITPLSTQPLVLLLRLTNFLNMSVRHLMLKGDLQCRSLREFVSAAEECAIHLFTTPIRHARLLPQKLSNAFILEDVVFKVMQDQITKGGFHDLYGLSLGF
jgi:hypothetical protein